MAVWFFFSGFVCIQLHLLHGMLFLSLSYFLISDCARRSPGKHSYRFWEPRQFFELVGRLRWYSLFATYEYILLISSVSRAFPLEFRPCSSFFKVYQLGCIIQVMVPSLVARRLCSFTRQLSPFLLLYLL